MIETVRLACVAILIATGGIARAQTGAKGLAVAWDDVATGNGVVQRMSLDEPYAFEGPTLSVGPGARLRSAGGAVYAVSSVSDTVTVIDAASWSVTSTLHVGVGSQAQDIAVLPGGRAYVSRGNATHLVRVDLGSGAVTEVVDLSIFADADGIPEMGTMAVAGGRLFVQIRRVDPNGSFVAPPALAVVDTHTDSLVDADPSTPGVQPIVLEGTSPKGKMQRVAGRLYVSASGGFFDAGGIEAVDTSGLRSLGLVVPERSGLVGADLGPFVFTGPKGGFLVFSTDLTVSSHLVAFEVDGTVALESPFFARLDYLAPVLAYDRPHDLAFFPDGPPPNAGVLVLDGRTGVPVGEHRVPTGNTPTDFALIRSGFGP